MELGDVFQCLSNSRRREVILSLTEQCEEQTVGELAVQIAALENGIEPCEVTSQQRKRVYIGLTQASHLEMLAEKGAIEYNESRKVVKATSTTPQLATIIHITSSACTHQKNPTENGRTPLVRKLVDVFGITG